MKKLMVALGAVAMAAGVQAAAINWAATVGSSMTVDSSLEGYKVYLCKSIAEGGFEAEADIQTYLYGTSGNEGQTVKNGARPPFAYATSLQSATGISADDVGMQTVYAVIVSKDGKGYWTASTQGEVYTTAESPVTAEFNAIETIKGNYTPWAGAPGPGPVPEPTSGLLLLLGVAGLALRRKQK